MLEKEEVKQELPEDLYNISDRENITDMEEAKEDASLKSTKVRGQHKKWGGGNFWLKKDQVEDIMMEDPFWRLLRTERRNLI
jgi:hypothetical protein